MSVMSPGLVLWKVAGRCPAMMAAALGSNARPLALAGTSAFNNIEPDVYCKQTLEFGGFCQQ